MLNHEKMMGIQRADMTEMKEVKVKIPVKQLLRLHYIKLTGGLNFSEVVGAALADYFAAQEAEKASA